MKAEGHAFPPLKESDAMFKADTAPEWAEGTVCFKCRTPFGVVTRKVITNLYFPYLMHNANAILTCM